jgi:hypothetical protein
VELEENIEHMKNAIEEIAKYLAGEYPREKLGTEIPKCFLHKIDIN